VCLSQGGERNLVGGLSVRPLAPKSHFCRLHKEAPIGQDSLDWKKIFTAARTGGIRNYFVEMDLDLMRASVPYLRALQI
jgi:hypothetical protein